MPPKILPTAQAAAPFYYRNQNPIGIYFHYCCLQVHFFGSKVQHRNVELTFFGINRNDPISLSKVMLKTNTSWFNSSALMGSLGIQDFGSFFRLFFLSMFIRKIIKIIAIMQRNTSIL